MPFSDYDSWLVYNIFKITVLKFFTAHQVLLNLVLRHVKCHAHTFVLHPAVVVLGVYSRLLVSMVDSALHWGFVLENRIRKGLEDLVVVHDVLRAASKLLDRLLSLSVVNLLLIFLVLILAHTQNRIFLRFQLV
jgi:hypothetical protein